MKAWREAEPWQKIAFLVLILLVIFLVWVFANPGSPFAGAKGTLIKQSPNEPQPVRPTPMPLQRSPDPTKAQEKEEE